MSEIEFSTLTDFCRQALLMLKQFLAYPDTGFNILGGSSLSCIASEAVEWL